MLLTTFLLTVVVDLTVAIAVGMVLAAFLFMKRMAESSTIASIGEALREEDNDAQETSRRERRSRVPSDVEVYDINGPFFFGAAEAFKDSLRLVSRKPRAIIFDMEGVPVIDSTGLRALTEVVRQTRKEGTRILLCGLQPGPRMSVAAATLGATFGPGELDFSFEQALIAVGGTGEYPAARVPGSGG